MKHIVARAALLAAEEGKPRLAKITFKEVKGAGINFGGGQGFTSEYYENQCKAFIHDDVCLAYNGMCVVGNPSKSLSSIRSYGVPLDKITQDMMIVCVHEGSSVAFDASLWPRVKRAIDAYNKFYAEDTKGG